MDKAIAIEFNSETLKIRLLAVVLKYAGALVMTTFFKVEHWLFTIGYSLAFGAVFVKMWRVYQIFHNPHPNKRVCAHCNNV